MFLEKSACSNTEIHSLLWLHICHLLAFWFSSPIFCTIYYGFFLLDWQGLAAEKCHFSPVHVTSRDRTKSIKLDNSFRMKRTIYCCWTNSRLLVSIWMLKIYGRMEWLLTNVLHFSFWFCTWKVFRSKFVPLAHLFMPNCPIRLGCTRRELCQRNSKCLSISA